MLRAMYKGNAVLREGYKGNAVFRAECEDNVILLWTTLYQWGIVRMCVSRHANLNTGCL